MSCVEDTFGTPNERAHPQDQEKIMNKKMASAGLLAGLVAGTGAGLIMQQSGFAGASGLVASVAPDTSTGTDTDTGAGTDGTGTSSAEAESSSTSAERTAERAARLDEVLAPLVADGTITQAQADAVVQALVDAGPIGGPGGRGGRGGQGGLHRGERGEYLSVAAAAIGIDEDALRDAVRGGSTIAEVAAINGVDVQVVIDAIVADSTADINQHVADGDITQERADEKLADLEARVTDIVNGVRPERPARGDSTDDAADDGATDTTTTG